MLIRTRWLLAATLGCLALVVAGCGSGSTSGGSHGMSGMAGMDQKPAAELSTAPSGTFKGEKLAGPHPRPSFTLTDTQGKRYDFGARTAGHPTLLYFGYTHCPDVCPTTMADEAAALRLVPMNLRRETRVVFVTTDPKRDTPPVIGRWLSQFDGGLPEPFIGLTGTEAQVEAAQRLAGVTVAQDGGQTHSAQVLLYGPDNLARVFFQQGNSPSDISHDLPVVAKQKG